MSDPAAANWIGLRTLYLREVRRFMKIHTQTIFAPVVTTLLFLAVFNLALGGAERRVAGLAFPTFLAPGLVMMAIAQNAFANASSSVMTSKIQGNIVDILMPPFQPWELTFAIALGGASRGVAVGIAVAAAMFAFVELGVHDVRFIVFHAVAASLMMSLIGIICGIWADKFEHMAAVTNFVITPLAFLSGTFYSIQHLPGSFQTLAHLNPFFYMIDGIRYGFIGHADGNTAAGLIVMAGINAALWWGCVRLFASGYNLKP